MAKISTRQTTTQPEDELYQRLLQVISDGTDGVVSKNAGRSIDPGDNLDELLETLQHVFTTVKITGQRMLNEINMLTIENATASMKVEEFGRVLDHIFDVSYDTALDASTGELMESMVSAGIAEITADGELQFDSRITVRQADLKPIVREAVARWLEIKIS